MAAAVVEPEALVVREVREVVQVVLAVPPERLVQSVQVDVLPADRRTEYQSSRSEF